MINTFFLFFLVGAFGNLFSQLEYHIALGDPIPIEISKEMYVFELNENGNIFKFNSEEILSYKFQNPGKFKIRCIENPEFFENHKHMSGDHENCSLIHLPDSFFVFVDSFKIIFNLQTVKFKEEIICGNAQSNNFAEINAEIVTYKNQKVVVPELKLLTAGIGTQISGSINPFISNTHATKLKYKLSGSCSEATFIQFDFLDQNNNATSFAKAIQKK
jgi:hypothetical protein